MSTIILPADLARAIAYEDVDGTEPYERVHSEQIDTSRWESINTLIVREKETGHLYSATYREGLTEHQDTRAWEYDKEVAFTHVVARTKTIETTEYVPVKPDDAEPEDPNPTDLDQIAVSVMLHHAQEINDVRDFLPGHLAEIGLEVTAEEFEKLVDDLEGLAETADISIGWSRE